MSEKKISVHGVPDTTGGILKSWNVKILENGVPVPRVRKFVFNVEIDGTPIVTMEQYPETIEIDLEGVVINKEIVNTRIFDHCEDTLKLMDFDFRCAMKSKGWIWKTATLEFLKDKLDTCHDGLTTIMKQVAEGDREIIDVTVFAAKLANYAMLLADRSAIIRKEEKENEMEKEKEGNDKDRKKEVL